MFVNKHNFQQSCHIYCSDIHENLVEHVWVLPLQMLNNDENKWMKVELDTNRIVQCNFWCIHYMWNCHQVQHTTYQFEWHMNAHLDTAEDRIGQRAQLFQSLNPREPHFPETYKYFLAADL